MYPLRKVEDIKTPEDWHEVPELPRISELYYYKKLIQSQRMGSSKPGAITLNTQNKPVKIGKSKSKTFPVMSKSKRNDESKKIQHYVAKSDSFGVTQSQQTQKNQPILIVDDIDNVHKKVENVKNVNSVKHQLEQKFESG